MTGVPLGVTVIYGYVDFTDTTPKTLFTLPRGATPLFAVVQTLTAFNDTGTDLLELGIAGDNDYFAAGLSVAALGGQFSTLTQSPQLEAQTGVTATYTGQNSNASAGKALVTVAYANPFRVK